MNAEAGGRAASGGAEPADPIDLTNWFIALGAILVLGLALRMVGLHDPILDHPGWRQGDTAAIARNFARLTFNIFYPQTDYNGPPPNYVELELQIVPFLTAIAYKLFGIHEAFGRLCSIGFSLGTVAVLAYFGRWLFRSSLAGLAAALLYAIFPGSVYYGRTFTPDGTMAFFLTAALFATTAWLLAPPRRTAIAGAAGGTLLLALAFLAKPVAVLAAIPVLALGLERARAERRYQPAAFAAVAVAVALAVLWAYLREVGSHAEWHWASGITKLHVLPSLAHALVSHSAFAAKTAILATTVVQMLATTMLGPAGFGLALFGFAVPLRSRANLLLYAWLAAVAAYAFAAVTVERVDYYLYPALPLAALVGGAFIAMLWELWPPSPARMPIGIGLGTVLLAVTVANNATQIRPYYAYRHAVYASAKALDAALDRGSLVVVAHYDPSILYYIDRKGWEEDPYLWTPFDEQSAIRKGARYFVAIEDNRFRRNPELYAWMQRFPQRTIGLWTVYETDPAKVLPGSEERWRQFRRREKAGLPRSASDRVPTTNGQLVDPTLPAPALTPPPEGEP